MDLDLETGTRFLAAICKQAIHDYRTGWRQPGYPDATVFLREAGRSPTTERPIPSCLRPRNPTPRKETTDGERSHDDCQRDRPAHVGSADARTGTRRELDALAKTARYRYSPPRRRCLRVSRLRGSPQRGHGVIGGGRMGRSTAKQAKPCGQLDHPDELPAGVGVVSFIGSSLRSASLPCATSPRCRSVASNATSASASRQRVVHPSWSCWLVSVHPFPPQSWGNAAMTS